jgi:hypothetical protein
MNRLLRCSAALIASACVLTTLPGCNRQAPALSVAPPEPPPAPAEPAKDKPAPVAADAPKEAERAADRGSKLVTNLLRPTDTVAAEEARRAGRPLRLPAAPALERPELPLPTLSSDLPLSPASPRETSPRPGPLPEGLPLARYRDDPTAPRREELPSLGLIRLPSPDVNAPVPLPILARPATDHAPLGDPTPDISLAAVLAQPVPVRMTPTPFVRLNLPDPFEHAQAVRLHNPPAEDPTPPVMVPRPPLK